MQGERYKDSAYKMNAALIELLEKKEWDQISVTEICKFAGVNRTTFYSHYENMLDLLKDTEENTLSTLHEIMLEEGEKLESLGPLRAYLEFVRENKKLYQIFLKHFPAEMVNSSAQKEIIGKVEETLKNHGFTNQKELPYVEAFYLGAINTVVETWLTNDCDLKPEEIYQIIKGEIMHKI